MSKADINQEIEIVKGNFTYCIYKSFNYAVYRFKEKNGDDLIVTGDLSEIDEKSDYQLFGTYIDHPKYGIQFKVSGVNKELPNSLDGIIAYLSSDLFKGVGLKKAQKIVKALGEDTLKILKDDVMVLHDLGIKDKDIMTIKEGLAGDLLYEESYYFLFEMGFGNEDIRRIINTYKENTQIILNENPFRPYFEISGIGYLKCEKLAQKLAFPLDSKIGNSALLAYLSSDLSFRSGNTYLSYLELKKAFLNHRDGDFDKALADAIKEKTIIEEYGRLYNYLEYRSEDAIARFMCENNVSCTFDKEALALRLKSLLKEEGIIYNDDQLKAIENFFSAKISFVVGGPGTGKTTIVKAISECLKTLYPLYDVHIVAPTGRAAKRLNELCDVSSSTIHSLLKWDKETNTFSYNEENPLLLDVLIIDEFSMVDNVLFYRLISALGNIKRICIIGDDNQLPSVASGNLLKDLLKSEIFKVTRLRTIYRQEGGSDIIALANDILLNRVDFQKYKKDVFFIDETANDYKKVLIDLIDSFLEEGFDLNDIQILAPMYKGHLGIDSLNNLLQDIYNPHDPSKKEFKTKYKTFRINDKILQLKNQSTDDVYNGDIGTIVDFEDDPFGMVAKFNDLYVEYTKDDMANIALAYAISIHKAQGSEYPIVFVLMSRSQIHMLNKNLLYTAVSRASSKLFIISEPEIFYSGYKKNMQIRKTSLDLFIKKFYNQELL